MESSSSSSSPGVSSNASSLSRSTTVTVEPSAKDSPSTTTFPSTTIPVVTFMLGILPLTRFRVSSPRLRSTCRQWLQSRHRSFNPCAPTGASGHFRSDGVTAQFSGNRTLDGDKRRDAGEWTRARYRALLPPSWGLLYGHAGDRMLANHVLNTSCIPPQISIVIRTPTSVYSLLG